jgi:uncharacterized membrane protein
MNPLKKLSEFETTIKTINADPTDPDNQKKGKRIKKKCLLIGVPLCILGLGGIATLLYCIITSRVSTINFTTPLMLFVSFFILSLGFKITSYARQIFDDTNINSYESKSCPVCKTQNSLLSTHCYKCGTKLK